jgi:phosphoglycolate phosphatase
VLVLLDLDGTLTDPYVGISAGIRHAFEHLGVPVPHEAVMRSMIGPPFQETFPALGVAHHQVDEAIAAYRSVYDDGGKLFEATLYDGIEHALDTLVAHGHTLALATSKPEGPARRIVEHFAILDRLTFVGGATADGSRRHKADVIDHVLRATGAHPSEAVMVGDRNVDVLGARAHGLHVIGVRWGYAELGELDNLQPTAIVEHPRELPDAVATIANR